jgi:hypothetical protein
VRNIRAEQRERREKMSDKPKIQINRGMLAAFVAMLALVGISFGMLLVLAGLFIIAGILFNALVTVEAINCLKTGSSFDQRHKMYLGAALAFDVLAFFLGYAEIILIAGIGAPLAINVFIYIEDKIRGR